MAPWSRESVNCPHCDAINPATDESCRACSKCLTVYIGPARRLPRTFGLGSLMVLVAWIAVGLGIVRVAPALGVLVLLLVTPAMIRTSGVASQRFADDRPISVGDKTWIFLASVGLMISSLVCAFLTAAAIFMTVGSALANAGPYGLVAAASLAVVVGLTICGLMLRKFWPYPE